MLNGRRLGSHFRLSAGVGENGGASCGRFSFERLLSVSLSLSASCVVFHARLKVASTVHQEQSAQSGRSFGVYSYCADLIGGTLARGIKRGKVIWFRRRKKESVTYPACFGSATRQAFQI